MAAFPVIMTPTVGVTKNTEPSFFSDCIVNIQVEINVSFIALWYYRSTAQQPQLFGKLWQ